MPKQPSNRTGSGRWRTLRLRLIQREVRRGMCACNECGVVLDPKAKRGEHGAIEVDHIARVIDRPDLQWDIDNLRLLCRPCHLNVTAIQNSIDAMNADNKESINALAKPIKGYWYHNEPCLSCPHTPGPGGIPWTDDQSLWDGEHWIPASEYTPPAA